MHKTGIKFTFVPFGGRRRTVNCAIAQPQVPRLVFVAVLTLDEFRRPLGVVVSGVAVLRPLLSIEGENLILVVIARIVRM